MQEYLGVLDDYLTGGVEWLVDEKLLSLKRRHKLFMTMIALHQPQGNPVSSRLLVGFRLFRFMRAWGGGGVRGLRFCGFCLFSSCFAVFATFLGVFFCGFAV